MTSDLPSRKPRRPRVVPLATSSSDASAVHDSILSLLGEQLGDAVQTVTDPRVGKRRLKGVHFEYDTDPRAVHDMAGDAGYSLASNWFTQLLGQLSIANSISKSQLCVFLYVAGGQTPGTGVAEYTQQEITDGLNELADKKAAKEAGKPAAERKAVKKITRPTVNRAVKALCEYKWFEPAGNGRIRLNVHLWFQGTSGAQHDVLAQIAEDHKGDDDPASAFPHKIGPEVLHHQEELQLNLEGEAQALPREERTG
ncbi:hypothetical protein [Streptomyces sp. NPDC102282]|uniref:hypothetical protein n=1 Tax=Streptomyces sp. NPDC102282 TaxID=3366154 RepID=UPI0038292A93